MVRKRSRKYDSDENDSDSDVDFEVEPRSRPAPKKYSLRERKRAPSFTTADYDYYGLDEDDGGAKHSSDDEDFEVEADVNGARTYFEPDPQADPHNSDGLIDFEDIIRADIVVNKNKIDYDNLIQKTEIKLTQPKKRGRKPKIKPEEPKQEIIDTGLVCEPELDSLEQMIEEKSKLNEGSEETVENEDEKCKELPNGDTPENGDIAKDDAGATDVTKIEGDPTEIKDINNSEMETLKPPQCEEAPGEEKIEDEDDDVIVLGELKHEVIVLDD